MSYFLKMRHLIAMALMISAWSCTQPTAEQSVAKDRYDVVIRNGRVMDPETNFDAVRNIGVKDGIIATITEEEISGKKTIDAHAHGMGDFTNRMTLRDGVPSEGDLEAGSLQIDLFYKLREGKSLLNHFTEFSHEYARHAAMYRTIGTENRYLYRMRAQSAIDGYNSLPEDISTEEQMKFLILS